MKMKKGISLIVLVITIIVMIILAASVIVSLSNTGVIDKANAAVDLSNLSQVQNVAALVWSELYMDGERGQDLIDKVKQELTNQGVREEEWNISISDKGIEVEKNPFKPGTLGYLLTPENYGDTVDYTVTVGDTVYNDWRIYYHNEDYVYIIKADRLPDPVKLNKKISVASLSSTTVSTLPEGSNTLLDLYDKFRVGDAERFKLADSVTVDGSEITLTNCKAVAQLITDYTDFANTTDYGDNVIGSIGAPTIELLIAGSSAKKIRLKLTPLTIDSFGYWTNGVSLVNVNSDDLYIQSDYKCWIASPSARFEHAIMASVRPWVSYIGEDSENVYLHPIVCLKASIPATVGTGDYDFNLTK